MSKPRKRIYNLYQKLYSANNWIATIVAIITFCVYNIKSYIPRIIELRHFLNCWYGNSLRNQKLYSANNWIATVIKVFIIFFNIKSYIPRIIELRPSFSMCKHYGILIKSYIPRIIELRRTWFPTNAIKASIKSYIPRIIELRHPWWFQGICELSKVIFRE